MISVETILLIAVIVGLLYCGCSNKDFFSNLIGNKLGNFEKLNNKLEISKNNKSGYNKESIIQYNDYNNMITDLICKIGKKTINNIDLYEVNTFFVEEYKIKLLLQTQIKEVISNDTNFQHEYFQIFDIKSKYFITKENIPIIKVIFSLINTVRYVTTSAYALLSFTNNKLNIEYAGLIYSNVENNDKIISKDLSNNNEYKIEGGISSKTEALIDKCYN